MMVQERDLFFKYKFNLQQNFKRFVQTMECTVILFNFGWFQFKCKKCNQVRAVLKAFHFLCIFLSNIEYEVM